MKFIYHSLFKKVNDYHKYLNFPYLQDNIFEVLSIYVLLDKVEF